MNYFPTDDVKVKKCAHCKGEGTTSHDCCVKAVKAQWGPAKCCACNGSGWQRV
jgi:hypothetical protein